MKTIEKTFEDRNQAINYIWNISRDKKVEITVKIEQDILENSEKKYFRKVLEPFRMEGMKVVTLAKIPDELNGVTFEHILVCLETDKGIKCILLTPNPEGAYFKNMVALKGYTPEELRIWEQENER